MRNFTLHRRLKLSAAWARGLVAGALGLVLLGAVISCRTVNRNIVLLPNVPGANYIGSQECELCHEEIYRDFATADHARLLTDGPNALSAGCESCHGPGSVHSDSGGEVKPPYGFTAGRPRGNSLGARLAVPTPRATETVCYECHAEVRGQFNLPSHHPAPEGRLSCMDCHSPHKGSAYKGGGTSLFSRDETCLNCHPAQRGPYVFEHEAMREGSTPAITPTAASMARCLRCATQICV